jgi:hypothetical protein
MALAAEKQPRQRRVVAGHDQREPVEVLARVEKAIVVFQRDQLVLERLERGAPRSVEDEIIFFDLHDRRALDRIRPQQRWHRRCVRKLHPHALDLRPRLRVFGDERACLVNDQRREQERCSRRDQRAPR